MIENLEVYLQGLRSLFFALLRSLDTFEIYNPRRDRERGEHFCSRKPGFEELDEESSSPVTKKMTEVGNGTWSVRCPQVISSVTSCSFLQKKHAIILTRRRKHSF